jgi:hypothetical protein
VDGRNILFVVRLLVGPSYFISFFFHLARPFLPNSGGDFATLWSSTKRIDCSIIPVSAIGFCEREQSGF